MNKKVLFALSECRPFIASGGLADVGGSLPQALTRQGVHVGVVMPLYRKIKQTYGDRLTLVSAQVVKLDWRNQQIQLYTLNQDSIDYYFVDCDRYYDRDNLYGYDDDIERFAFFCNAVCELLAEQYDIVHCHDWQTACIPSLLKYKAINRPTILTIHNIEYQGTFDRTHLQDLTGLPNIYNGVFEWNWQCNLLKGGIVHCDKLTTVSHGYAMQILTAEYGAGLEKIIQANKYKLSGILNGIDTTLYNASTDNQIIANFDSTSLANKQLCKAELQRMMGLEQCDKPLFAMVTRLAHHKGLDLVEQVLPDFLHNNVQFVLLGTGDNHYEDFFSRLSASRENLSVKIAFDNGIAKSIYAGADFFVMPSKSEPCGLAQMISCAYATLPIVRNVGGLGDSIDNSYGIVFDNYDKQGLEWALYQALMLYSQKSRLALMRSRAIKHDFSWEGSAKQYIDLYNSLNC
ncbi:MAG: glycogen synthase [Clostridia bacterium]|nr:glycogen synthase [Clostridia bacterium]